MKRKLWMGISLLALVLLFLFFGVLPRLANKQELQAAVTKEQSRIEVVNVVPVVASDDTLTLSLPGQIQPLKETVLFARTQGYLKNRLVDIGSQVKKGQLLAMIEAPELDQEIRRAKAEQKLAGSNLDRSRGVTLPGAISQQDMDSREATYAINVAKVRGLQELKALQEIRAPFSGTISSRNLEIGALINAGSSNPLFTLSQQDTLRVLIAVPQTHYRSIQVGQQVQVKVPEIPGQVFTGKIIRTSGVLRPDTRTLLTEVVIPNPHHDLIAGLYAQVNFLLKPSTPPILIPANTLIIRPEGSRVMVVGANNVLRLQPIDIGRDFGTTVEVVRGLSAGEHIVTNPTDNLLDGQLVKVANVTGLIK